MEKEILELLKEETICELLKVHDKSKSVAKNKYEHSIRVLEYATKIMESFEGENEFTEEEMLKVKYACVLHDCRKFEGERIDYVDISGKACDDHALKGARFAKTYLMEKLNKSEEFANDVYEIIRKHSNKTVEEMNKMNKLQLVLAEADTLDGASTCLLIEYGSRMGDKECKDILIKYKKKLKILKIYSALLINEKSKLIYENLLSVYETIINGMSDEISLVEELDEFNIYKVKENDNIEEYIDKYFVMVSEGKGKHVYVITRDILDLKKPKQIKPKTYRIVENCNRNHLGEILKTIRDKYDKVEFDLVMDTHMIIEDCKYNVLGFLNKYSLSNEKLEEKEFFIISQLKLFVTDSFNVYGIKTDIDEEYINKINILKDSFKSVDDFNLFNMNISLKEYKEEKEK